MKRRAACACGAALLSGSLVGHLHAQAATASSRVAAARAAIAPKGADPKKTPPFHVFQALFDQACQEPKLPDVVRTNDRSAIVPRKEWFAWPANIFDSLYFIGTRTAGVWAVNTAEGIIVIDANFHYSSKDLVLGLLNFGLDPNNIKYIIITHAHDDRYWGAKALQDTYPNARIAMSAADWDVVAKDNSPPEFKPKRDMVIADGQKITLGGITVTAYVTPGHTPGTLSLIVGPLTNRKSVASDEGQHWASIWGGVDASIGRHGVQYYPDGQTMMRTHVASLRRFMDLSRKAGADVILTPTLRHMNFQEKLRAWRYMNPDESGGGSPEGVLGEWLKLRDQPHPFVNKDAVERHYTVLLECYEAQLAWRAGS
ncbi:MAG: MBL fold metallo-hydrolase [Acidobacteria bacterium]|nr:MBL fold metallo-hydrolase [Acidobacteriota bacterium]